MEEKAAHILVIDDEVGMREGCRRALARQGFQVTTAEHGAEGLHLFREGGFDLVLLDAMMPGMSGLELLQRIQEQDPDMVCLMITGFATVDLATQAMKQGAQSFLPKPFTSDELLSAVKRGLEERSRRRESRHHEQQEEEAQQAERARQEMARLDAMQSRFMLLIAHELRNPAGVIRSYVQLMRAGYVEESEWDTYLERLDLRASQLLGMLDDILELAYLKEKLSPSKLTLVAAADILEEVVRSASPAAQAKGLLISLQIQGRPMVFAEASHLQSLWRNLIENAIQYTVTGGITVLLAQQNSDLVTSVRDTGIGVSNEEIACIFQEFYRTEGAKEMVPAGTGLGLAIVNQIVKVYSGAIEVDSTPGKGTTFTVRLSNACGQA